jgi:hypothetical protein
MIGYKKHCSVNDKVLSRLTERERERERERDDLTYALGNKEHSRRVRGMGVIPWKKGFSADMESYKKMGLKQTRSRREVA